MSDSQKMNEIANGLVSDLPEGWVWCRMEEIAQINPRHLLNVLPENIEVSFLPMPNLNEDTWKIKENKTRPFGEIRKGYTHFAEDDVLFAKITPCMENGKAAIARNLVNRIGCGTTELHVIRPHGSIPPEFIYHYIHQESFRQEAEACMTGTAGQLRVPVDFVASASIPIPPLQEQILIVNRIELLLERTRKAKESLDKIPLIMKRFRQAALKKAFSGELTAEWRAQQQDLEPAAELLRRIREEQECDYLTNVRQKKAKNLKKQEIDLFDTSELPELPDEWVWCNLRKITQQTICFCSHR
jgi:type I restriction enzyme S subunit